MTNPTKPPLRSSYADDPEMSELVRAFVQEMPDRIAELERVRAAGNDAELESFAHKLNGAAGGYGFQEITDAARELEAALVERAPRERVSAAFDALLLLCRRAAFRILLAEDCRDNRRVISHFLKPARAEIVTAENGLEAVEKALGGRFDVVLMDMEMPKLDGYGAARALREQGYRGTIIALTAHALSEDRKKCLAAGCDDYVTKPIDRKTLLDTVSKYLEAIRA